MALFSILQELINLNFTYKGITGKKKVILLKHDQLNRKPKQLKHLISVILVKFIKISIEFSPFFFSSR